MSDISTFLRELKQLTVSLAHFIPGLEQADRVGTAYYQSRPEGLGGVYLYAGTSSLSFLKRTAKPKKSNKSQLLV